MAGKNAAATKDSTTRLTPAAVLKKLLSLAKSTASDIDEARGTYTQAVGEAVEKKHLHKKAWATARREDKMEPEALREYYEHLDYYREALGLEERAASAPALPIADEEEEDSTDTEEAAPRARTVVRGAFPPPSSVAAE